MANNSNNTPTDTQSLECIVESLVQSEAKYKLIFENALEGIMIMQEGKIIFANPMLIELTGYSLDELKSKIVTEFVHPNERALIHERFTRRLNGEDVIPEYSFRLVTKSGDVKWVFIKVAVVDWEGKPATLSFLSDITEQKQLENELLRLSQLDSLTGIANRRVFNEKIDNEWKRAIRDQSSLSLIMIDIDHFKAYNDHYGHLAGDDCLKLVADILGNMIKRPSDLIARYGGEEFVVILQDTNIVGACMLAEEMRCKVKDMKIQNKHPSINHILTISIGVSSVIPSSDITYMELLKASDTALYLAKRSGRNQVCSSSINGSEIDSCGNVIES